MKQPIFANTEERIRHYGLAGGAAYKEGAAVVLSSGNAVECGADPALIAGFAMQDAGSLPLTSDMPVSIARAETTFFASCSRAPLATDVGAQIGITKDADGIWYADFAKTGASARISIEKVDTTRAFVEFKVLPANRQLT